MPPSLKGFEREKPRNPFNSETLYTPRSLRRKGDLKMADYIPSSDSEFTTWQENFLSYVNVNLAALGLKDTDVASLNASQSTWKTDYSNHTQAQATAESARQTKAASRKSYETLVRSLVRRLQGVPNLTDAQRAGMQISLRETSRQAGRAPSCMWTPASVCATPSTLQTRRRQKAAPSQPEYTAAKCGLKSATPRRRMARDSSF